MFLALAAIENAVAVNPDLRLELYVHPQTREMICVCCSIYFGGGSSVWHNFRHAGPSWQGFQASQLELGIAWPSSYQGMERRPKELEPVTNLPSLNAETWDGRCSWKSGLEAPSITFGRRNYSHMTSGPFYQRWRIAPGQRLASS